MASLTELKEQFPHDEDAIQTLFSLGDALFQLDKNTDAITTWQELLARVAASPSKISAVLVKDTHYNIGVAQQEFFV